MENRKGEAAETVRQTPVGKPRFPERKFGRTFCNRKNKDIQQGIIVKENAHINIYQFYLYLCI